MSVQAANYWLDVNGTTSGSGVANGGSYDWTAANWGDFAGTATPVVWPGGSNQAFMNGAGPSTSYTVRLGATGSTNVTLQNFAININSAANGGSGNGDVVIGNPGDTGILTLNATNSVGAQNGGVLTVNNGINLNAFTLNLRGGDVVFNGVVSGTGASRIALGGTALGFTTGPGTLTLANTANTYAGRLNSDYIGANFTLAVTKLANGGSNSSIGTSSANIGVNGGTLKYIGSTGAQTTNLGFHMASGGTNVDASGVGSGDTIEFSGAPTYSAVNSARALTLTGANDGDNTIAFVYGNNGSGVNTLTKSGSGKWVLNQANSYTGVTTIGGGVLNVATLSNYSTSGALGARTAAQEAAGDIGLRFLGGTLQYTGATAQSTDRQIRIGTAGATLDASGSAPSATMSFTYSGANTDLFDSTGTRTLTLTGSNTGNNTFAIKLEDQGGNATSLTKSGSGKWVLTNTNTHTGGNTINGGTLAISGDGQLGAVPGSPVANSIIFNNGGKLSVSTSGATLNVNRGITLTGDGTLEATGTNNLVYRGKITGPGVFTLSMPGSTEGQFGSAASDYSGGTILTSGSKFVIFDDSTGSASTANLTAGAFGTGPITMNNLNIRTTTSGAKTVGNAITLQGNLTMHAPGTGTSQNLTFNGPVTLVGGTRTLANSGNSNAALLTLSGVISDGGSALGLGISSTAGRTVVLSGANTYTGVTTITSGILNAATLTNYSVAGALGARTSAQEAATDIGIRFMGGTLQYTGSTAQSTDRQIRIGTAGGTIDASGSVSGATVSFTHSAANTDLFDTAGTRTLTLTGTNTGNNTFAIKLEDQATNATSLIKSGAGKWVLTNNNTYTGATTISGGTLVHKGNTTSSAYDIAAGAVLEFDTSAGNQAHGSTSFTTMFTGGGTLRKTGANEVRWADPAANFGFSSGALIDVQGGTFVGGSNSDEVWTSNLSDLNVAGGATFSGVEASVRVDAITGSGNITTGYSGGGGSLTIGVDNGSSTFNGVIANGSGTGSLIKQGTGAITLTNANTFTGGTTISGGTIVAANAGALGVAGRTVRLNTGATLDLATNSSANAWVVDMGSTSIGTILVNRATSGAGITHVMGNSTLGNATLNVQAGALVSGGSPTLQLGGINMTGGGAGTLLLNPTTADVVVTGAVNIGLNAYAKTLGLGGTSTGNEISGVISNNLDTLSIAKSGSSTWELSGANTYTGSTTVSGGTLILSGARSNAVIGTVTVGDTAGQNATLNISNGTHNLGAGQMNVGNATTTAITATVNQTGGSVIFAAGAGNQLLLGQNTVANQGIYNLSGGSLTIGLASNAGRGIMLGVNSGSAGGTFNLSGSGVLNMTTASGGSGDANLAIGRYDSNAPNTVNAFNQTGGTANVGSLSMGGSGGTSAGVTSTLSLTGGVFSANQFARLAAGNTNTAVINIGGTADVTLPAFPTARGTSATATINFDGGTLRPLAASATYMGGLTAAYIKAGGANFDVASGKDITITQDLLTHGVSTGGGLTKSGAGTLTLSGTNTYTGSTHIAGGTLVVGSGLQLGPYPGSPVANSITFSNGGVLEATTAGQAFGVNRGITMLGNGTLSSSSTDMIYRGKVTGAGQLTLDLPGSAESQWGLNTSDYSGGTIVAANTKLVIFNNSVGSASTANLTQGPFGTGTLTINDGVSLRATTNNAVTIGNAVTLQGNLTIGAAQTQLLTFNGPVTITGASRTVTTNASGTTWLSGDIGQASAGLGFTKAGSGQIIVSGNNTYTGITTVSGGVLRVQSANALPGGIGVSGGTSALTFNGGVLGLNSGDFTRNLAAAGTVTGVNFTGAGGWAGYGVDRIVNLNNDSHAITWSAANTGFNGQTLILGASVATSLVDFQNPIDLGAATRTVQVDNGSATVDGKFSGVLSGTGGNLNKTGTGTLQLTAANSFSGTTGVSAGTLQLIDGGTLASVSGVTISSGATLSISNTPATATTNRVQDGAAITMTGGTLAFTHTAGAADYSETFGALTVSGTGNVISASQAASGQKSTLNFASLSYTPGALQFQGAGLGLSDERNRIFISGLSAGAIGSGVTYFDGVSSGTAGYSLANGVVLLAPASSVNILGGVIVDNSTSVGIVDGGTSGDITLSSPVTAIQSLAQNATSAGTVDMSGKTLRAQTVVLGSADGSLNLGNSPGSGTLTPAASGGSLTLNNNYGSPTLMTVNAVIANHGPSASLVKTGAGTVRIASGATYSGATDISGGTLALVGAGALADSTAVNLSNAGSVLDISGISASGESIGTLSGVAGSSVVLGGKNLTTLGGGTTFAGVISGAGGSLTHSSLGGTLELTGLNTFTGPVTLGTGAILSVNQLLSSGPQPLGEGTSAITFNGNANDYSALVYTGTVDGFISRELNMASGDGGMISVSDSGVKVTLTGALTGGSNVDFRKDGPGKLVLAGSEDWNGNALVQGGTLVIGDDINPGTNSFSGGTWNIAAGATMRINTTGSFESTTITKDGTFRLESGTLRTNTLAGNGDFTWGNATLSTLGNNTMGLVDRTDPAGSPSGPVVREGNVLVYTGALTTGGTSGQGSLLDLGATVLNDGLRYNQISISGALNLSGVDTLNFSVNPYFLRPNTASSVITGDWGSLILVRAASFTGTFDGITGIGNDGIGWRLFTPGQNGDPSFTGAGDLPLNTYYIEYATNSPDSVGVLGGPAILFHYKVAGSVPEPASVGLMIAGALLLRTLSLRRLRSY